MSSLTRDQLKRALKEGRIESLYLLFGAEDYLRDRAASAITEAALKDAALREFNEISYSLTSTDVRQALAAAEEMPMMAQRRVVRISDFGKIREADEGALLRYLMRPAESTVVIFVADDLDKRRKLTKTLLDVCVSIEFASLKDAELIAWAKGHLKKLGAEADERTVRKTVELVGSDVRTLSNEMNKLATAALPGTRITMELVDELVGRSRELSNFQLTDRLIARDRAGALQTLQRLLDDGAEPVMLIGLIASNYRRLALAKELMSRGAANHEVYRQVGIFGRKDEFLATARRTDANALSRSIQRIAEADLAMKSSITAPRLQVELLVCELAR